MHIFITIFGDATKTAGMIAELVTSPMLLRRYKNSRHGCWNVPSNNVVGDDTKAGGMIDDEITYPFPNFNAVTTFKHGNGWIISSYILLDM